MLRWPLWFRRICGRVYSIGGSTSFSNEFLRPHPNFYDPTVHSGCAVSGVMWLIAFTGQATKEVVQGGKVRLPPRSGRRLYSHMSQTSVATLIITYVILALLLGIVTFAYPTNRSRHHDTFERTHRFLGWIATALVWGQVRAVLVLLSLAIYQHDVTGRASHQRLQKSWRDRRTRAPPLCVVLAHRRLYHLHHCTMAQAPQGGRALRGLVRPRRQNVLRSRQYVLSTTFVT